MIAPTTSIFRQEALEYRARQQGRSVQTEVTFPRLMARRAWIALWVALVVFAIGAALACLPSVPVRVTGLAVVPAGDTRIAVLSTGDAREIGVGDEATITIGERAMTGTITAVEAMTPAEAARRLGLPWPAAAMPTGPATVAWVELLDAAIAPGTVGSAEVTVGSRQAGSYLPLVGGAFRSDA